jgi:hypothetical protein
VSCRVSEVDLGRIVSANSLYMDSRAKLLGHRFIRWLPKEFMPVMDSAALAENTMLRTRAARRMCCWYSSMAACVRSFTHLGGPLSEKTLKDGSVVCVRGMAQNSPSTIVAFSTVQRHIISPASLCANATGDRGQSSGAARQQRHRIRDTGAQSESEESCWRQQVRSQFVVMLSSVAPPV